MGRRFVARSIRWVDTTFDGDLALVTAVTILALGRRLGASVLTDVIVSEHPTRAIAERAAENDIDLVVLGSELRPLSRRAFLGHRAEYVLKNVLCPVALVSSR
ncbi:hypothetical protein BG842_10980 [Haladaptatus sp. W1]|uniref:universal stress protein n=1 Tax=Haladaptatus sp. W1 TaxID=1897478 RepID=UPI000849BEFA|nr:universal stress protein [Haladaptatus sp. W1]ODR80112.1 hypothetical protein BG842_10980 [Haladaptatus sp. W1]